MRTSPPPTLTRTAPLANCTSLIIGGLTPLSTVDYPGLLAAVIFCQGCAWACPYCHNAALRVHTAQGERAWNEVVGWLEGRRGLLDAVVFSGGEPTLQSELGQAMATVSAMGFRVGLHSGGMVPQALGAVLAGCDWVGLDIKAPRAIYARITGVEGSGRTAWASLELVRKSGVAFEVRTTWHPALLGQAELTELARELVEAGVTRWVLQGFRPEGCADAELAAAGPAVPEAALLAALEAAAPGLAIVVRV